MLTWLIRRLLLWYLFSVGFISGCAPSRTPPGAKTMGGSFDNTLYSYHYWDEGLAILVWHFYAVIFDPAVYPMDPAWLSGRSAPARERERQPPHYAQSAASDRPKGLGSPGG